MVWVAIMVRRGLTICVSFKVLFLPNTGVSFRRRQIAHWVHLTTQCLVLKQLTELVCKLLGPVQDILRPFLLGCRCRGSPWPFLSAGGCNLAAAIPVAPQKLSCEPQQVRVPSHNLVNGLQQNLWRKSLWCKNHLWPMPVKVWQWCSLLFSPQHIALHIDCLTCTLQDTMGSPNNQKLTSYPNYLQLHLNHSLITGRFPTSYLATVLNAFSRVVGHFHMNQAPGWKSLPRTS